MKTVVIDGEKIQSVAEFHDFIPKELHFPDCYGKNWSAAAPAVDIKLLL